MSDRFSTYTYIDSNFIKHVKTSLTSVFADQKSFSGDSWVSQYVFLHPVLLIYLQIKKTVLTIPNLFRNLTAQTTLEKTIWDVVLVVFLKSAFLSGNLTPEGRLSVRISMTYQTRVGGRVDDCGASVGLIPRQTGRVSEMAR